MDDLERQSESSKSDHITSEQLNSLQAPTKDNLKKNSFLTDEKLKSIISFLDEVETADRLGEIDSEINQVRGHWVHDQLWAYQWLCAKL